MSEADTQPRLNGEESATEATSGAQPWDSDTALRADDSGDCGPIATAPLAAVVRTEVTSEMVVRDCPPIIAVVRRLIDFAVAFVLLVALSPLLVVIAVAVRLDSPGGPIFKQRRVGRGQRSFVLYKFRTMRAGSDGGPHRDYVTRLIAGDDVPQLNGRGRLYKLAPDADMTRIGRVLRRWSLDELPQLWNVVTGDMSLIGPRPVILYEAERYPPEWGLRFAVKPGLTGLWQVSGRNHRTYREMIAYDLEYIRTRSLRLDWVILVRTVPVVLLRRGVC